MKELWDTIQSHQENNKEEDGISFTYEEFSKLYNLVAETGWKHTKEVKLAMGKGALIGAVGVGLIGLGIQGISKIRKNKSKSVIQVKEVEVVDTPSDKVKRPKDTKEIAEELLDSYRKRI